MGEALSCHLISPYVEGDDASLEFLDQEEDVLTHLGDAEINEGLMKRLLSGAELMTELYTPGTTTLHFSEHRRSVTEFKGGYKIAVQRGARLNEVKVFNLFFRIKSNRINSIDSTPVAQMYTARNGERLILLHPVDTIARIDYEKTFYLNSTLKLVNQGKVSDDAMQVMVSNLSGLNINERCAQTLMHEYGHILHWRAFDGLFSDLDMPNVYPEQISSSYAMNVAMLFWFQEQNYIYNVANRVPNFLTYNTQTRIHLLKESFVEDYRISLNMQSLNGKFILPNAVCVVGDLMTPELGVEGVRIVRNMLNDINNRTVNNNITGVDSFTQDMEHDRITISSVFFEAAFDSDWEPGKVTFTESDVNQMFEDLVIDNMRANADVIFGAAFNMAERYTAPLFEKIDKIEDIKNRVKPK
ncbi:hypothetical protein [Paenibacillus sp. FSL R7-0026]|uniref:hypothetical protein n=1 Tax=Paenibacillus sp. FSL R7-0026 TaxID=2921668 RepID=UPI0030FD02B9